MKPVVTSLTVLFALLLTSCGQPDKTVPPAPTQVEAGTSATATKPAAPVFAADVTTVTKDFSTWYQYTASNIHLARPFTGLDPDSAELLKANFLDLLETGRYIPLLVRQVADVPVYQLFRLHQPDRDIVLTVQQMAATEKEHTAMEGKSLPTFNFTDLNGRSYTRASTTGKTMLLKCWFINCFACVQEFPALNKLVDRFKERKDLLFVSLASDNKQALTTFLQKRTFNYAVVPNQGTYMSEQLHITAYPTHLLVSGAGKIIKVTNIIDDMLPFLETELEHTRQ